MTINPLAFTVRSPGLERAGPVFAADLARGSNRGPGKNVVPKGSPNKNGERREVKIGWRPLAIGGGILKPIRHLLPRETQHWAVVIGRFYHELGIDEDITVVYRNGKVGEEEFDPEDVGYTTFNDQAIVDAGIVTSSSTSYIFLNYNESQETSPSTRWRKSTILSITIARNSASTCWTLYAKLEESVWIPFMGRQCHFLDQNSNITKRHINSNWLNYPRLRRKEKRSRRKSLSLPKFTRLRV